MVLSVWTKTSYHTMYKHHGKGRPAWRVGETVTREPGLLWFKTPRRANKWAWLDVAQLISSLYTSKEFEITSKEKLNRGCWERKVVRILLQTLFHILMLSLFLKLSLSHSVCAFIDQGNLLSGCCGHSNNVDNNGVRPIDRISTVNERANHLYFIECNALFLFFCSIVH